MDGKSLWTITTTTVSDGSFLLLNIINPMDSSEAEFLNFPITVLPAVPCDDPETGGEETGGEETGGEETGGEETGGEEEEEEAHPSNDPWSYYGQHHAPHVPKYNPHNYGPWGHQEPAPVEEEEEEEEAPAQWGHGSYNPYSQHVQKPSYN